jgi:hypothetical protein
MCYGQRAESSKHVPFNEELRDSWLCALPFTSTSTQTVVTCQTARRNETSDDRNPAPGRVQGICGEKKAALTMHVPLSRVNAPPSNVNRIFILLSLGDVHNRCERASRQGNQTITLLSLVRVPELAKQRLKLIAYHWLSLAFPN